MKKIEDTDWTYEFPGLNADARLRELILYIAEKCSSDEYFGSVKLNKILYFADQFAYASAGKPVSGCQYLALPQGPAPSRLATIKEDMLARKEIVEQARTVAGGYTQRRIIPLRPPDLNQFSGQDISFVDAIIDFFRKKTASDISFLSHGRAWRIAYKHHVPMPYEAVFLDSHAGATEYETARAKELAEKFHWNV